MVKIPQSSDKPVNIEEAENRLIVPETPTSAELIEHIQNADQWASDWSLRELMFDRDPRKKEHQIYANALYKVCLDYSEGVLKEFPLGIARWLAQEAESICEDLPSQILKRPEEGVRTANFAQENQFELIQEEWKKQGKNPAFVLQALSMAKEQSVLPPNWVLDLVIEAGTQVYLTGGDVEFGEALELTPKKIKEAHSGQKKVWIADLVAEAIDGGLSSAESRELAIFEAEIVFGWPQYTPATVQKYYENHTDERDGFSRSFMYLHRPSEFGSDSNPLYHSIRLPYWRRKVLKARLEAYREAVVIYPDVGVTQLTRMQRLTHVVAKTVAALSRNEPPKNSIGHYIETDF